MRYFFGINVLEHKTKVFGTKIKSCFFTMDRALNDAFFGFLILDGNTKFFTSALSNL